MKPDKYGEEIHSLMLEISGALEKMSEEQGRRVFSQLLKQLGKLDLKGDKIMPTVANLKKIKEIEKSIERIILNKDYKSAVNGFTANWDEVTAMQNTYFLGMVSGAKVESTRLKFIYETAVSDTRAALLESGVHSEIIEPIIKQIRGNIGAGGSWDDMIEQISTFVRGNDERLGAIERHIGTIATDSLNTYHASRMQAMAEDLGFEWYLYTPGVLTTSRPFCQERTGNFYHISEIKSWAGREWKGKNPNTTGSNILQLRGGYRCRHQFAAVLTEDVPDEDRARIEG